MKILILSLGFFVFLACGVRAADAPVASGSEASKLISSIASDDYATFVTDGNPAFQQLKKERFESVVSQLASKLKSGYDIAYLGELNQKGYQLTLWRIRFKSGGDDLLATLSMKDGKVGGFWIK
jgi:hypothetical protein